MAEERNDALQALFVSVPALLVMPHTALAPCTARGQMILKNWVCVQPANSTAWETSEACPEQGIKAQPSPKCVFDDQLGDVEGLMALSISNHTTVRCGTSEGAGSGWEKS